MKSPHSVLIITGPSGSGKDTIGKQLQEQGLSKIVSTTTREKRISEKEGEDYFFIDHEKLNHLFESDQLIQKTTYSGTTYGITKEAVLKSIEKSNSYVIIHPKNVDLVTFQLERMGIPFKTVYIDTSKSVCTKRMIQRGDKLSDIKKREETFNSFSWFKDYANILVNGDLDIIDIPEIVKQI